LTRFFEKVEKFTSERDSVGGIVSLNASKSRQIIRQARLDRCATWPAIRKDSEGMSLAGETRSPRAVVFLVSDDANRITGAESLSRAMSLLTSGEDRKHQGAPRCARPSLARLRSDLSMPAPWGLT
jgi:hypothetical protein